MENNEMRKETGERKRKRKMRCEGIEEEMKDTRKERRGRERRERDREFFCLKIERFWEAREPLTVGLNWG